MIAYHRVKHLLLHNKNVVNPTFKELYAFSIDLFFADTIPFMAELSAIVLVNCCLSQAEIYKHYMFQLQSRFGAKGNIVSVITENRDSPS